MASRSSCASPADAVRHGLALCPEERKTDGIVAELSVRENIALALQARLRRAQRFLSRAEQAALAERFVKALGIKTASVETPIGLLSGGNQQKAMLARWLATAAAAADPRRAHARHRRRGQAGDHGTRSCGWRAAGMAVLFISSEMSEVVRVSHRIAVLRDRRKVGELPGGSSEDAVYELIAAKHDRQARTSIAPHTEPHAGRAVAPLATSSRHRLAWPLVTLLLLLAVNAAFNPSFLHLEWRDGHLYGSLIDILNRAAPLVLVSLGMTLVIATRGIDISVGAVVAIAAAVAAWMIGGSLVVSDGAPPGEPLPDVAGDRRARWPSRWSAGCGTACWWRAVGMQPIIATLILMVAGRGIAQLITGGQIITIYYAPFFFIGSGYLLGLPFSLYIAAAVFVAAATWRSRARALGLFIQAVGINPTAARVAGVRARRHHRRRLRVLRLLRRRRRPADQLQRQERRRQQRRPAARARRDPRGDARRHGAHRRALQPGRQRDRRADHPDADLRDLFARRAARDQPGGQGGGGVRR